MCHDYHINLISSNTVISKQTEFVVNITVILLRARLCRPGRRAASNGGHVGGGDARLIDPKILLPVQLRSLIEEVSIMVLIMRYLQGASRYRSIGAAKKKPLESHKRSVGLTVVSLLWRNDLGF
ncbi:hypothetical protein EVAR_57113_1 [Eumeta japonica]|uniref:Uncharacterized protein n=1 Tax=Eumeta variegata TaxID=151549 RepID=A0A4C1SGT0_EUMVA|nr:hypothetical protein EVAR_57113_1 [Eumeta japonica]